MKGSAMPTQGEKNSGDKMSLTRDEILVLLIEECGEVIQAATKCLRFGWDNQHDYRINHESLAKEMGDLLGAADALLLKQETVQIFREMKICKAERVKREVAAHERKRDADAG
jgi:hypothetical protein